MSDPAGGKQKKPRGGKRFVPGQSGNPAGRPAGLRNQATVAIEAILEGEAASIGRKAVELALAGDSMALKLCLERLAPLRRGRPVHFALPPMEGPSDLVRALGGILHATATGALTPEEAGTIATVLEVKRRALETTEMEARLAALEQATGK